MPRAERAWDLARRAFLSLAAARDCPACKNERDVESPWCDACAASVRSPSAALLDGVKLVCAARYESPVPEAVRRFKYAGDASLALAFARLLEPWVRPLANERTALVPVPVHPARLVERGYNQAALLARALGGRLGLAAHARLLARSRPGRSQASLDRSARQAILTGVFRVRRVPKPLPDRVLLVDDVVTTGATARACVAALRGAGLTVTAVVAVARAERFDTDIDAKDESPPRAHQSCIIRRLETAG
ncbi:MAG TPA: ComF family protein [Polyangiaceae bacterium]